MAIFKGRVRVRYGYSRWGYTRNNGKGWHGGSDEEGLDSTTIRMPDYKGKSISGRVVTARKDVYKRQGYENWTDLNRFMQTVLENPELSVEQRVQYIQQAYEDVYKRQVRGCAGYSGYKRKIGNAAGKRKGEILFQKKNVAFR